MESCFKKKEKIHYICNTLRSATTRTRFTGPAANAGAVRHRETATAAQRHIQQ